MEQYKNIVNGTICSMAKIIKETDKAFYLNCQCEIYGELFNVKFWMPKSQITIIKKDYELLWFTPNNDWILNCKIKDYCTFVAETYPNNVKREIRNFLAKNNIEKVNIVFV